MAEVKILYEDKDIIVVVKPAGMASQEERSADMDMVSWLKNYFVREKKVKGMPYIGVIHRLDKPVGGVMVYAKTQQAAGKLSEQAFVCQLFSSERSTADIWCQYEVLYIRCTGGFSETGISDNHS